MRLLASLTMASVALALACTAREQPREKAETWIVRLGAYEGERISSTHLIRVYSPWVETQYLSINFPEHCWGTGLPNVSHMSEEAITTPWQYNEDSTEAVLVEEPRPGVTYRSLVKADSMAARLELVLENQSDTPISEIRTLVCTRPDAMAGFHFGTYAKVYVWVDGGARNIELGTTFEGEMPIGHVAWALNVEGGPDNSTFDDLGWFRPKSGPGRIVDERARPPLIAARHVDNPKLWIATLWQPARMVFSNAAIPCIHSDPLPPDCPAGGTVRANGIVMFHEGSLDGLLERARREMGILDKP
ncbi:MAG: hypothetical protein FVQ81_15105 [Candidatus Glassbacteria bacterium]|nr:hypothetical protein [Candidatus Glassbacteria bacterium]